MISPTVTPTLRNTLFTTIPSAGGIPYTDFGRVMDYSTQVGPFTIVDKSGEGNTATLYSGRGLTMDAVGDNVTYATGYSLAERTATLWGRFNVVSPVVLGGQSGFFTFYPTATGVWEELTATATVSGDLDWELGSDFDIGDLRVGTEHWTHNDWSDPTGDTSNGKTIVDSGPNQLHGTCTGCSGFTGEATIPQTADKNWNKGLFFNGVDEYLSPSPTAFDPSADGQVVEFSSIQTGSPAGAEVLFGYRDQATELIQITQQDSTTLLIQVRGSDNIIKSDSITVGAFSHITGTLTYNGVLKTASLVTNQGTATVSGFGTISTSVYMAVAAANSGTFGTFFNGLVAKMDINGVDALQATRTGTPDQQLISASDANDQIDALGTAILEPRLNTQQLNLFGEGEYSSTPDSASLDVTTTATWEIWGNFYGVTASNQTITSKQDGGASKQSFALSRIASDPASELRLVTSSNGSTVVVSYLTGLTDNINHVVITHDGATWASYVDGIATTITGTAPVSSLYVNDVPVSLGARPSSGVYGNFAPFKIGSAKIYNVALTADEVLTNYNTQKSLYGL